MLIRDRSTCWLCWFKPRCLLQFSNQAEFQSKVDPTPGGGGAWTGRHPPFGRGGRKTSNIWPNQASDSGAPNIENLQENVIKFHKKKWFPRRWPIKRWVRTEVQLGQRWCLDNWVDLLWHWTLMGGNQTNLPDRLNITNRPTIRKQKPIENLGPEGGL